MYLSGEIPNTRGMSQYADGGVLGSKPYAGSASYINKMSPGEREKTMTKAEL